MDHKPLRENAIVELPFERPVFPGAGERYRSYDSAFRVFSRKVMYARFRRVSRIRFKTLRPEDRKSALVHLPKYEMSNVLAMKRRISRGASRVAYLNKN